MLKQKLDSTKKFVVRNQTRILLTTTAVATTAAVIMRIGLKQHNDFLKDHDLYEEFYAEDENE